MSSPRSVYSMASNQPMNKEVSLAVEGLFETQSIADIKEKETKTRADIEEKKTQLRSLVGDSYRDVISSADTILAMDKSCKTVLDNIKQLQNGMQKLSEQASGGNDVRLEARKLQRRKQLHALGGRVKYLVDTPEMIWGFMDTYAYLEAAKRYMQAEAVHNLLSKTVSSDLRAKFPLVKGLWPNIQKFRSQILDRINVRLSQQEALLTRDFGLALSAFGYLQESDSKQCLDLFLQSRLSALEQMLGGNQNANFQNLTVSSAILKGAIHLLQETVWQTGRLFLSESGSEHLALISALPFEDGLTGQLAFVPIQNEGEAEEFSEDTDWQEFTNRLKQNLSPLTKDTVSEGVKEFLSKASESIKTFGKSLIGNTSTLSTDIAEAEKQLRASISSWKHEELNSERTLLTPMHSQEPKTPRIPGTPFTPTTPWTPFTRSPSVKQKGNLLPTSWQGTCEWVTSSNISLWELLLESVFEQVEKESIKASFTELENALKKSIKNCVSSANNVPIAPPGSYRPSQWPSEEFSESFTESRKRARTEKEGQSDSENRAGSENWRLGLNSVKSEFNGGLQKILKDACILMEAQDDIVRESRPRRAYSGNRFSAPPIQPNTRSSGLQKHVVETCKLFTQSLRDLLQNSLGQSQSAQEESEEASSQAKNSIECVILIAQLSLVFASNQSTLVIMLGPPEHWKSIDIPQSNLSSGAYSRPPRRKDSSKSRQSYAQIQQVFRELAVEAHTIWAKWVASMLGKNLESALLNDSNLTSNRPLTAWQETVVNQEEAVEGENNDTKFSLPNMASSHVVMSLLAASRELQRAGGNPPGSHALDLLRYYQSQAFALLYRNVSNSDTDLGKALTETGALQLLFDTRFLRDIFVGARKSIQENGDLSLPGSFQDIANEFESIELALQERLDPIDWAIYAMYLWKNEALFFQKVRILCGSLLWNNSIHSEVPNKGASLSEANIMSSEQNSSRFAYLPISVPSSSSIQGPPIPSIVKQIGIEDESLDSTYSFARLETLRSREGNAPNPELLDTASSEMLNKSASQRLGVLGSLLGDRAAEVTAMAQQSFSDISLPSAFSTLSGPSSGASGLFSSFRGLRGTSE